MMSKNEQAVFKRGKLNKKTELLKVARDNPIVANVLQQHIHGEISYTEAIEKCVILLCVENKRENSEVMELLKEARKRFYDYQMDADESAPQHHRDFMKRMEAVCKAT